MSENAFRSGVTMHKLCMSTRYISSIIKQPKPNMLIYLERTQDPVSRKKIQSRRLVGSVHLRNLNETVFKPKVDRKYDKS